MRVLALLVALATPGVAAAQQQLWKEDALLADMFPEASVTALVITLTPEERAEAEATLGYPLATDQWTLEVARTAGQLTGFALFDDQQGQHEPITFAVQFTPEAVVVRHEVVVYREKYGSEIENPKFRAQFVGKTANDPLVAGKDIRIVSGATYSSKAMAVGVRRAAVLASLLVRDGRLS